MKNVNAETQKKLQQLATKIQRVRRDQLQQLRRPKPTKKSRGKHGNRKTSRGELTFDSAWEARRWDMLLVKLRNGQIHGLRRQVTFRLHCDRGHVVCRYRADFVYVENGRRVVEDAKGHLTAMYRLKRKWMLLEYGIQIKETYEKDPSGW